ncbi:SDR family NAD(P)-dependent oxidoreductase [uncultured Sphingomonas sp.]|uniref:SDR family NAD(P)-dependent oxidoreductase n=1 Tax=uncultured Sphingomonas sp. TaxID=158754 RepID=UPI0035CAE481
MANKLAIVTGASTGIGFELAHLAAQNGYDLIVAADEPLIDAAAADFKTHGVSVESVEADLSTAEGIDRLLATTNGRQIHVLCANAGRGLGHGFLDQSVADWRKVIDTNVFGTSYILQKVLARMVAHGEGKVLVTGSIAGHIPGAFQAVYNASKAYLDNFVPAIINEIKDHKGVTITNLMPGPVETEFFDRGGMMDTDVGQSKSKSDPADVAKDGWEAMMAGKSAITSGWKNKVQTVLTHVVPDSVLAEQHRAMAEPGSGNK